MCVPKIFILCFQILTVMLYQYTLTRKFEVYDIMDDFAIEMS